MSRPKAPNKTPHNIRVDDSDWKTLMQEADRRTQQTRRVVSASELVREAAAEYAEKIRANASAIQT